MCCSYVKTLAGCIKTHHMHHKTKMFSTFPILRNRKRFYPGKLSVLDGPQAQVQLKNASNMHWLSQTSVNRITYVFLYSLKLAESTDC